MILVWFFELIWAVIRFIFWDLLVQELIVHLVLGIAKSIGRLFFPQRQPDKTV